VTAVHDEIKAERVRNPFLAHGVLFVPDESFSALMTALQSARHQHRYYEEIHYREIKGASAQNSAYQVARDWTVSYFSSFVRRCPFKVFIVENAEHRSFPYPGDEDYPNHLLRSLVATVTSGLAWSFHREAQVRLRIVHDDTDSEVDRAAASALPYELQARWNTRKVASSRPRPHLRVRPAEFVDSDPKNVGSDRWPESEFIQLCDLLLGAAFDALNLKPIPKNRHGRLRLSRAVMAVLGDTLEVPWLQQVPVHRKFSVSLYPDRHGFAYPAALRSARVSANADQPMLPGFNGLSATA
jgi:hypothetical protein